MSIKNCEYCSKEIETNNYYKKHKHEYCKYHIITYYHPNCLFSKLTDDCPKFEQCGEVAIENYKPIHNEGRD